MNGTIMKLDLFDNCCLKRHGNSKKRKLKNLGFTLLVNGTWNRRVWLDRSLHQENSPKNLQKLLRIQASTTSEEIHLVFRTVKARYLKRGPIAKHSKTMMILVIHRSSLNKPEFRNRLHMMNRIAYLVAETKH